jgi:hypothetical protein
LLDDVVVVTTSAAVVYAKPQNPTIKGPIEMGEFKGYGPQHEHFIKKRITDAIAGADTVEIAAETVMQVLNEIRLLAYNTQERVSLLTATGRAFVVLVENPDSSIRDVSTRLGVLENAGHRAITKCVEDGLVERQKRGNGFTYTPAYEEVWKHPDVWRFALAVLRMSREQPE